MILQALSEYYERKSAEPAAQIAPPGFEWKEIPFIIELDTDGALIQIEDTREGEGRKNTGKTWLVPQAVKRAFNIAANLLWDNAEYVLGVDTKGKADRVREQHAAFVKRIQKLPEGAHTDAGITAVLKFLGRPDRSNLEALPIWPEIMQTNPNISFRLRGELGLVCQRPAVRQAIESSENNEAEGICLVSGESDVIERLHPSIKGVWGAQPSGANIVSFQRDSGYDSYGKTQGANAPVGKRAAFAYTTALNYLLRKDSPQRLQVGDASAVFWAQKPSDLETGVVDIFGEPPKDDPDRGAKAVKNLLTAIQNGVYAVEEGQNRFYVLGLAPNAARISVRFWHSGTVAEMADNIKRHFDDLEIVHADFERPYLPLFRLLVATAVQGKADNIPPNLGGDVMRAIIAGLPYPQTLLAAAVRRIRAEQAKKNPKTAKPEPNVDYPRAALIKACINRSTRYANPNREEELKVSLDETNNNPGYRLGRLFAVLEKIQEEANPGINATIRDRFYGAASSTPVTVFSTLMKLKNHHLAKLDNRGRAVNLEKLIGQILEGVQDFPSQLALSYQGRFAIGYYHQRQDFFKKSDN